LGKRGEGGILFGRLVGNGVRREGLGFDLGRKNRPRMREVIEKTSGKIHTKWEGGDVGLGRGRFKGVENEGDEGSWGKKPRKQEKGARFKELRGRRGREVAPEL